jgi:exopolysaccharide biosynthesis polyprenyl glycosylphosphotransferase
LLLLAAETDGLGARFVAVWLMATALSFAGRWVFDAILIFRFGHGSDLPRAVLIGNAAECRDALEALSALPMRQRLNIVGLVDLATVESDPAAAAQSLLSVPRYEDLEQALRHGQASEVVITDPQAVNGHLRGIMDECRRNGVALKAVVTSLALSHERVGYVPGLDCPLFLVQPKPTGGGSYVVKRVGDRLAAGLLLLVLSPLLAAIAIAIRLTSPGPALFPHRRVGICQGPFTCYKFRTMVDDAQRLQDGLEDRNEAQGALFKIRDDPRVTPIGRVLRRYSLDELPQLLNVLKGDMSLVGPRPLPLRDGELMEEWHRQRHVVLPGMTGLWQIGGRSDIGFDEMLELDLRYIDTWSLRGDMQIIWRTLGVVLGARGAY